MIVIYGTKLAGRTSEIPGIGYVATEFFHLYWIPFIPLGCKFIVEESSDGHRGAPVGFYWKSVMRGWWAFWMLGTVLAPFVIAVPLGAGPMAVRVAFSVGLLFLAGFAVIFVMACMPKAKAKYEEAMKLANMIGLNRAGMAELQLHYGKITQEEADEIIAEYLEEQEAAVKAYDEKVTRLSEARKNGPKVPISEAPIVKHRDEAAPCSDCGRTIPPTRTNCMYCGGAPELAGTEA